MGVGVEISARDVMDERGGRDRVVNEIEEKWKSERA